MHARGTTRRRCATCSTTEAAAGAPGRSTSATVAATFEKLRMNLGLFQPRWRGEHHRHDSHGLGELGGGATCTAAGAQAKVTPTTELVP